MSVPNFLLVTPFFFKKKPIFQKFLASAIVQAKLYGYRGGEGVVQVAQRNGEFASFMAVLDQLDPNKVKIF